MLASLRFVSIVLSQRNKLSLIPGSKLLSVPICLPGCFCYFLFISCCAFQGNHYKMVVLDAARFASLREVSQEV